MIRNTRYGFILAFLLVLTFSMVSATYSDNTYGNIIPSVGISNINNSYTTINNTYINQTVNATVNTTQFDNSNPISIKQSFLYSLISSWINNVNANNYNLLGINTIAGVDDTQTGIGGIGGNLIIRGGNSLGNDAGNLMLYGGECLGTDIDYPCRGGAVYIKGKDTYEDGAAGAEVSISAGDGLVGGSIGSNGGALTFSAGKSFVLGDGGDMRVQGGEATNGNGGDVYLEAGLTSNGYGGDSILLPSEGTLGNGIAKIYNPTTGYTVGFNTSLITTADRLYTFPDKSGTFALLDDLSGVIDYALTTCYQESVNVSNQSGIDTANCGLKYTGSYSENLTSSGSSDVFINYTKPSLSTINSKWLVKGGFETINFSLSSCWNAYPDKIVLKLVSSNVLLSSPFSTINCYNGSQWVQLKRYNGTGGSSTLGGFSLANVFDGIWTVPVSRANGNVWVRALSGSILNSSFYEEAMYWDVSTFAKLTGANFTGNITAPNICYANGTNCVGLVPYTGATADLDLGFWSLYAQSLTTNNGFIYFPDLNYIQYDGFGNRFALSNDIYVDSDKKTTAGRFISTIATGTAPYSTTSTTLNTNLNADLLDGIHASSFATLLGNWSMDKINYYNKTEIQTNYYNKTQINSILNIQSIKNITEDQLVEDVSIYENEFYNVADLKQVVGTIQTANIDYSGYYIAPTTAGNDAQMVFYGTGAGTGTTTNSATTDANFLRKIYSKHRWGVDTGIRMVWGLGHYQTAGANDFSNVNKFLGFFYNSSQPNNKTILYGYACSSSASCTKTQSNITLVKNNQFELLMIGNNKAQRGLSATNYSFYARFITDNTLPSWTYLGYIDTNIPAQASDFGMFGEGETGTSGTSRVGIDYIYVNSNRDYYMQT